MSDDLLIQITMVKASYANQSGISPAVDPNHHTRICLGLYAAVRMVYLNTTFYNCLNINMIDIVSFSFQTFHKQLDLKREHDLENNVKLNNYMLTELETSPSCREISYLPKNVQEEQNLFRLGICPFRAIVLSLLKTNKHIKNRMDIGLVCEILTDKILISFVWNAVGMRLSV